MELSRNMTQPTLVLDLDGTLAETHHDLIPTLNRTIAKAGLAPVEMSQVGYLVGRGIRPMLERAFQLSDAKLEPDQLEALNRAYLADYAENICVDTILYENAGLALDRFLDAGWTLAVCTNKLERLAKDLLNRLAVGHKFTAIAGADTFAVRKPDPGHLLETIRMAGGDPSRSLMVGDSITDVKTARNADVPVVGVTFGYSDLPIQQLEPDAVIDHFDQLYDIASALVR